MSTLFSFTDSVTLSNSNKSCLLALLAYQFHWFQICKSVKCTNINLGH